LAGSLQPLGVESEVFDDVERALEELAADGSALLTVNALRWRMAGEKYDPYRKEWFFELSDSGRQALTQHVAAGGGVLGLHTASI
jgi:hypothetical protein